MWNTRYFVVPVFANGWRGMRDAPRPHSAIRASRSIPTRNASWDLAAGKRSRSGQRPRISGSCATNSSIRARGSSTGRGRLKPVTGLSRESRSEAMQEILYPNDMFWYDDTLTLFDPHEVAWVSRTDLTEVTPKLSGRQPTRKSEVVKVNYPTPNRGPSRGHTRFAGACDPQRRVLSGLRSTIDDEPAPIYRVNGFMRGAMVSAGQHRLDYSFAPRSFQIGLIGSDISRGSGRLALRWGSSAYFDQFIRQFLAAS